MKITKLNFFSIIIIVFIAAGFAFAESAKSTSTTVPPAPSKAEPFIKPAPVKNPATPVTAANPGSATVAVPAPPPPADNYSYNPAGKPDPFRPYIVSAIDTAALQKKMLQKAAESIFPLQRAEVDKYRVVGIAGDKDYRVAVAEDSAKKFYPLLIGTRIGLRGGKVVEIMSDRVIVEEIEDKKVKRIILKLRKN